MSDYVIVDGQLYHHGVKGMKWGVRRYQNKDGSYTPAGRKRYISVAEGALRAEKHATDARRAAYKSLNESPKRHSKLQYDVVAERAAFEARKKSVAADKKTNRQIRAEKKETRNAINEKAKELNKNATVADRILYNDATRQLAAKYIVKNNMSVEDATKKAQGAAWRNTAAFIAVYGGIMAASIYKASRG